MARGDLLKRLFTSYQTHDDRVFREAAAEIIDDEKRKHHETLATELTRILQNGNGKQALSLTQGRSFEPVPFDQERRVPLLSIKRPDRYLEELILHPSTEGGLKRIVEEYRAWEILEANGLTPVRRVLFCGPSGCGKTATAEALSTELGLPLLYIRFDAVVSSLLGETAANLRRVFDYAARGQWVVFFDEFDAIGRSRDDTTEHGEIKRVVNSFLQILDSFDGRSLVIAATNFEQVLDPALWRRFDEIIRFGRPDKPAMQSLIEKRMPPIQVAKNLVSRILEELSGASFADAERVCLDIRKSCAMEGQKVADTQTVTAALHRWKGRKEAIPSAKNGPVRVTRD
ncbi:MAG: ATP-binding protein [Thermoanaerobaculia bacterium]|nr:ATP-binding protein [Thermoanaerobaculia bacterium]